MVHFRCKQCFFDFTNAPLIKDVLKDDIEMVERHLKNGADPNGSRCCGLTLLHYAVMNNNLNMCQLILENNANPNLTEFGYCWTPLHYAAKRGNLEICQLLVSKGAAINAVGYDGQTALYFAVSKGEISLTKYLLELNANPNLKLRRSRWTPLHYAAMKGDLEISRLLVSNGATIDAFTSDGRTPLCWSVIERKVSMTKYLLEQGANPNLKFDKSQCTPLHYAARDGELEICYLLLSSGALMDALDASKWTPLHFAARYGNLEICRLLISSGASVNALDDSKWTPLHYAARYSKLEICLLLVSNGAEINCLTSKNDTPLMLAYCNVNDIYSYISEYLLANKTKFSDEIMRFRPKDFRTVFPDYDCDLLDS
ncbi:hypothetical protein QYM36_001072 [Artemia franciscana]|uniref:Uncharacterized protein n=1 Tax=Artemia franciscana TaxID=6661 RepID=A0AA88LHR3_ARTSF|nr:hypothetical protein QYM36_001072 [Artemia franciscana]